jgi:cell shape-determining protein MreD
MIDFSPRRWLLIPSLGVALLLTLLPLPEWASELRPPWVALTLLYWILATPSGLGSSGAGLWGCYWMSVLVPSWASMP